MPDGIALTDLKGNLFLANRRFVRLMEAGAGDHGLSERLRQLSQQVSDRIELKQETETASSEQPAGSDWIPVPIEGDRSVSLWVTVSGHGQKGRGFLLFLARDGQEPVPASGRPESFEQHYRALLDISPDAVVLSDLEGRVITANLRAAQAYGCESVEELVNCGCTVFDFIAPEDREQAIRSAALTLKTGKVRNLEYAILRRDGTSHPAEVSASLVVDAEGNPCAFIGVVRDITERKRVEQELAAHYAELARVNAELKKLHSQKDDFIASISHELRTPLVTGLGYLEMTLAGRFGSLPDEAQQRLATSRKNLRRLSALIDDIVEYHSLTRGEQRRLPIPIAFDLAALVTDCVNAMLVRTDREPDSVVTVLPSDLPPVLADPEMIRQAIGSLLKNALRQGGEEPLIHVILAPAEQGFVRLTVQDDGRGISPEIKDQLLLPFIQTESDSGSGFGLSILHSIAEAHGSKVIIHSEPDKGTSVSFDLAIAPEHLRLRKKNGKKSRNSGG